MENLAAQFTQAVDRTKSLTRRPGNDELLELYALYKQATEGDVSGELPGGFDFKAIAKYNAWEAKNGVSREQAMADYVALADKLVELYK